MMRSRSAGGKATDGDGYVIQYLINYIYSNYLGFFGSLKSLIFIGKMKRRKIKHIFSLILFDGQELFRHIHDQITHNEELLQLCHFDQRILEPYLNDSPGWLDCFQGELEPSLPACLILFELRLLLQSFQLVLTSYVAPAAFYFDRYIL